MIFILRRAFQGNLKDASLLRMTPVCAISLFCQKYIFFSKATTKFYNFENRNQLTFLLIWLITTYLHLRAIVFTLHNSDFYYCRGENSFARKCTWIFCDAYLHKWWVVRVIYVNWAWMWFHDLPFLWSVNSVNVIWLKRTCNKLLCEFTWNR